MKKNLLFCCLLGIIFFSISCSKSFVYSDILSTLIVLKIKSNKQFEYTENIGLIKIQIKGFFLKKENDLFFYPYYNASRCYTVRDTNDYAISKEKILLKLMIDNEPWFFQYVSFVYNDTIIQKNTEMNTELIIDRNGINNIIIGNFLNMKYYPLSIPINSSMPNTIIVNIESDCTLGVLCETEKMTIVGNQLVPSPKNQVFNKVFTLER